VRKRNEGERMIFFTEINLFMLSFFSHFRLHPTADAVQ
jgi:hypothetical protein